MIEKEFDVKLLRNNKKISRKVKNNLFIHYDKFFEWPDLNNVVRSKKGYCSALSKQLGILSNGTIVPCCLDNDGNISLGNVKNNTIVEVLNSKKSMKIKNGFKARRIVEDLCQKCTYIKRFEKQRDLA